VLSIWGIFRPKAFQIRSICCLCFEKQSIPALYLIHHKTREGKSAVVPVLATLLHGITLVLVPLIGLGCHQLAKGFHIDQRVKAFNLDEHQCNNHILLRNRLLQ
jgi:hypothetical protein